MTACDHVYPVTSGEVDLAGVEPTFVDLPAPQSLDRFADTQDWDVADMSAAQYLTRRLAGDDRITALPIFTSRMFQHSRIYVRKDRIRVPEDLRGAKVAAPEPATTAGVYACGLLADSYGIQPGEMSWVSAPDHALRDMLLGGEIDAVLAPQHSQEFRAAVESSELVGRLFDRPSQAEREYFGKTKVFPIMSVLGIRRELLEQHRWLATNIYRAFEVARRRYFFRLEDIRASRVPIASVAGHVESLREVFGADIWPYGVAPNRATLESFVRYAADSGLITAASVDVDELFVPIEPFVDGM